MNEIPSERRERNPLITAAGYELLDRIVQHEHAPRWNFETGDRVEAADLEAVEAWRSVVAMPPMASFSPPPEILAWVKASRHAVDLFKERVPETGDLSRKWAQIPTMGREELVTRIPDLVPRDADLSRLIVYDTSGTTGHALRIPHHPRAVALLHPLVEHALSRFDITLPMGPDRVSCINLCAQAHTYIFANVFSVWEQAGFAKVNLNPRDWAGGPDSARAFLGEWDAPLITADPITLAEMMAWNLPIHPDVLLSTAVDLDPAFAQQVQTHFGCPLINWYSTTETGPLACSVPDSDALVALAPDIYLEAVDADGRPVAQGEMGEITVTGGRNPYLPLLRYRTGDRGRVSLEVGPYGLPRTVIRDLQGREAVFFRATDGSLVNPVDVGRVLRDRSVFVQHSFVQHADRSCEVRIRPIHGLPVDVEGIGGDLRTLFGAGVAVDVVVDPDLGTAGKVVPYRTELAG